MKMKKFFLYGGLVCHFFCLFSMHNSSVINAIDAEVERVTKVIDAYHLKYPNSWSLVRRLYNFVEVLDLTSEEVEREMQRIESHIAADMDKESVLQKLMQDHWYVQRLMQGLVDNKIKEFNAVKGSEIDKLCDDAMTTLYGCADKNAVENLVYKQVLEHFFRELEDVDKLLLDEDLQGSRSIYFTILKESDQIKSSSLAISTDGIHVKASNYNNADIVWDTESGGLVTSLMDSRYQEREWITSSQARDSWFFYPGEKKYSAATQNYYAMVKKIHIFDKIGQSSSGIEHKSKAIVLFKRPEPALYWNQKAFDNSKDNLIELIALQNSRNLTELRGFPQENLKQLITKRINKLMAP